MTFRLIFLLAPLVLAGCAGVTSDAQIPPFARQPYQAFSRSAAIAIALREWRLFGNRVHDNAPPPDAPYAAKPEREEGLWQRVGEYWWLGLPNGAPEQAWTGMHDAHGSIFPPQDDGQYAWSAAFISYVMRIAGAGAAFPYAADHAFYINAAVRHDRHYALAAENPLSYAPVPGDLVCLGRLEGRDLKFADLPAGMFHSHCDLVVDRDGDALTVIGGNVEDAVSMKHVPVDAAGLIMGPDGMPYDTRYHWFVVLRVNYVRL